MRYTNNKFCLVFCILFLQCSAKEQAGNHLAKLIPLTTTISDYFYYYDNQPSDCECSNSILHISSVNSTEVKLVSTNASSFCPNMNCSWTIFTVFNTSNDLLLMWLSYSDYKLFDKVKITNCKSNLPFMPYDALYHTVGVQSFVTQETELCVTFNSYELLGNIERDGWTISFQYITDGINLQKIVLNQNQPITIFSTFYLNTNSIDNFISIISETNYGAIELGAVMLDSSAEVKLAISVYDAGNLTNFTDIYTITKQNYTQIAPESGNLTIFFEYDTVDFFQLCYRSKKLHSANCNTTNNLKYAYPWNKSNNFSIAATSKGKCLFSVVPSASTSSNVTYANEYGDFPYYIHCLHIVKLKYEGPGKVETVSGYNETYKLFDFSSQTDHLWNDTFVYGELISFIIPPHGQLYIEYENPNYINKSLKTFDMHGSGIIQSVTYPLPTKGQDFTQRIQYTQQNGYATFNITIIFAEIPDGGFLTIFSGDSVILNVQDEAIIHNNSTLFNGTFVVIEYFPGKNYTRGILIEYEGKFSIEPTPGSVVNKYIIWAIVVSSLVLAVLIAILITCYYYKRKKDLAYMNFIIDVMKTQKQLSPEEIEDLKEKRDEFTIPKKKLKIYYEMPLGQGVSSTVYIGFIFGKSPLAISTNLNETQRFQDCKVAVKVPTVFGSDESEQLFREIDTMKKIRYHKNVICMLGVCFLDGKPVVAIELVDKDLLDYVQSLKETKIENSYFSPTIFLSILWQIAKGMQFIASNSIVHRDLAARNILLTDSFIAKISDFGLSCSMDNSAHNEKYLPKKLPVKWLSIEALVSKIFSEKSDVWAFGVLMFEVFSFGQIPYPDFEPKDLMEYLTAGNRLGCPQAATEEIYEIMMECWKEDPKGRPTFRTLANVFHEILEKATQSYGHVESAMDE